MRTRACDHDACRKSKDGGASEQLHIGKILHLERMMAECTGSGFRGIGSTLEIVCLDVMSWRKPRWKMDSYRPTWMNLEWISGLADSPFAHLLSDGNISIKHDNIADPISHTPQEAGCVVPMY